MRFFSIVVFVVLFIVSSLFFFVDNEKDTIKIGLLYSKSGTMKDDEKSIHDMLHFAVDELNYNGGVLNQKIEIVEYDGASDEKEFAKGAEFFADNGIEVIFGCWTSASRKSVKPVIEKNSQFLFYPVQYEGVESSKNILYLGSTPNQQINPMLSFIEKKYGKNVYVVGSNYIYPRLAYTYIDELSKFTPINIVGFDFVPLGSDDFKESVKDIIKQKPDAIINLINGSSNGAFFKELYDNGISASDIPVFSTSLDENSLSTISPKYLEGHHSIWGYFNSINNDKNKYLKQMVKKRYGDDFKITDAGYSVYIGFEFYKRILLEYGKIDLKIMQNSLKMDSFDSAMGIVYVDPNNNHLYKSMKIGKIKDGDFSIIWSSDILSTPYPYPEFKSKDFWIEKEKEFYNDFSHKWQSDEAYGSFR